MLFRSRYKADSESELVRRNTRSLDSGVQEGRTKLAKGKEEDPGRFLAFKALAPRSSISLSEAQDSPVDEMEMVREICDEVVKAVNRTRSGEDGNEGATRQDGKGELEEESRDGARRLSVEEKDIISLEDAKKSTGYLEQLGYSLKKLVWA